MTSNVALVVLDSLRYDSFAKVFDWLPGQRFSKAYSTSHWTVPAHASLFTGYYPSEVGVHCKSLTLDCSQSTLAEVMHGADYTTRCFTANSNIAYWDGWRRGFDEVVEPSHLNPRFEDLVDWTSFMKNLDAGNVGKLARCVGHCFTTDVPTIPALRQGYRYWRQSSADGGTKAITKRVAETGFGDKEFLVVNLMETHTPYHAPDEGSPVNVTIGDAFADDVDSEDYIRSAYAKSVEYLSQSYQELFSGLSKEFDYVITLGDHGELLGEDGMWNHGYGLLPELVRIPLVISGPGIKNGVYEKPVSIIDVHKTIAELTGLDVDSRGKNLLGSPEPRELLTEFHGFLPWHEEQFERKGVPKEVYDKHDTILRGLVTEEGQYSYETHGEGVRTSDANRAEEVMSRIKMRVEELNCKPIMESDMEVNDEVKKQLKDLGYA